MNRFAAPLFTLALLAGSSNSSAQQASVPHDEFYWLGEFNKASTVMVVEQGIVSKKLGTEIAAGVTKVINDGNQPGAKRPKDYLQLEALLIAAAGPDITRMHSGRSRQDLIATSNRVLLRSRMLELAANLSTAREHLQKLAADNVETIVPAYTNGVQAQPITLGHYLLAFDSALARESERLRQAYARLNLSPLGSAALGTSSFPVNRARLADLLGFDGVAENSYDANEVSSLDIPLESASIAESIAMSILPMIEDIEAQYRETEPWILLREGKLTGPSSIMPQKRNPYGLVFLRQAGDQVIGDATTFMLLSHNVASGMPDYKHGPAELTMDDTNRFLEQFAVVVDSLVINRPRALAEVNADYSTTTELADILQRDSDVPFRIGHHFASELVTFGRAGHLKAAEIPYADAQRIYTASAKTFAIDNAVLPLSEAAFRRALTPESMVNSSQGQGGPQPAEVRRMLASAAESVKAERGWTDERQARLARAETNLERAFEGVAHAQ